MQSLLICVLVFYFVAIVSGSSLPYDEFELGGSNVTYYCRHSTVGFQACNSDNSQLPSDLIIPQNTTLSNSAFICLNVTYNNTAVKNIEQCAYNLTNGSFCTEFRRTNTIVNCTVAVPATAIQCGSAQCNNSISLPRDLHINSKNQQLDEYVCLSYDNSSSKRYQESLEENNQLEGKQTTQICAHPLKNGDLCLTKPLKNENCTINSPTALNGNTANSVSASLAILSLLISSVLLLK
ncbi:hypothetical protein HHI36_016049 [Cryptolaemus montrouzieri]|uniref:Uncharacterized protein n=1 Tax=Cryptolaemus montrouzieri TaxID=559131 RepID=A0ABD2N8P4_9CUCU